MRVRPRATRKTVLGQRLPLRRGIGVGVKGVAGSDAIVAQ